MAIECLRGKAIYVLAAVAWSFTDPKEMSFGWFLFPCCRARNTWNDFCERLIGHWRERIKSLSVQRNNGPDLSDWEAVGNFYFLLKEKRKIRDKENEKIRVEATRRANTKKERQDKQTWMVRAVSIRQSRTATLVSSKHFWSDRASFSSFFF